MVSRELMLLSHQNRTEQLQDTLRQKMRAEDAWREKVMLDGQGAALVASWVVTTCSQLAPVRTLSQALPPLLGTAALEVFAQENLPGERDSPCWESPCRA